MKGIMFKPDMHDAIHEGRKTVTRRIIKPQPNSSTVRLEHTCDNHFIEKLPVDLRALYPESEPTTILGDLHHSRYQVGEVVYIKEGIRKHGDGATYVLDGRQVMFFLSANPFQWRWERESLSPMFLPHEAARDFIQITDVRAERLQEIKDDPGDCIREGLDTSGWKFLWYKYAELWDSINKKNPWETNPFVWRYSFVKVDRPVDMVVQ